MTTPRWMFGAAIALFALPGRADAPAGRYQIANGTVTDVLTGLVWQQVDSAPEYTWADAVSYCSGLSLDGTGWRLPTLKELETIVDVSKTNPAVDSSFSNTSATYYWTATPVSQIAGDAWYVHFSTGYNSWAPEPNLARAHCVR